MRILLVRHAHSLGNEKKIIDSISKRFDKLSKTGKKEAEKLANELKKYKIDIIITSPLKRTTETIKPFLKENPQIKHIISKLTIERDAGEFTGRPSNALKEYRKKLNNNEKISFRPKGGESILDVYKRAEKFAKFLKENFKNKTILICGHKNFLMCLEIVLTHKNIKNYYQYKPLKNKEFRGFNI